MQNATFVTLANKRVQLGNSFQNQNARIVLPKMKNFRSDSSIFQFQAINSITLKQRLSSAPYSFLSRFGMKLLKNSQTHFSHATRSDLRATTCSTSSAHTYNLPGATRNSFNRVPFSHLIRQEILNIVHLDVHLGHRR